MEEFELIAECDLKRELSDEEKIDDFAKFISNSDLAVI